MVKSSVIFALGLGLGACSGNLDREGARHAGPRHCAGGTVRNDAELGRYADCVAVSGDLDVSGVDRVTALARLRAVEGALAIHDTRRLYSLAGLENLRAVGTLRLERNEGLISIGSLNALTTVGHVTITRNNRLSRLNGFLDGLGPSSDVSIVDNVGLRAEGVASMRGSSLL